jgi:ketosteroid isomerase-like protein
MEPETSANDILYQLLQHCYFDNIDNANANKAVEAFTKNAVWIHTQVWEHDGHDSTKRDAIRGRAAIYDFLSKRIHEMQAIGFKHKVHKVVCDGRNGAFQASVVMPGTDTSVPFFGWVELEDGRISSYKVFPER